jgi:hypothetical protein
MLSHLLSKLPASRPADWGFNVSVGIVIICDDYHGLVCISDGKATFSDFSADHAAVKTKRIYRRWWVVYAGDDVEYAPGIIGEATAALGDDDKNPPKTSKQVVTALNDAYWTLIHSQIESRVLRKQKFSVDTFRETGSKKCTATIYNNLCAKIDKVEISLQFLVYGFDNNDRAHIFLVDGKEEPKCYDSIGVWAIGSGAHAALSSLAFHIDRQELNKFGMSIERAAYFACEAKFMAESSGHVGRDAATLTMHRASDPCEKVRFLLATQISKIKEIWKNDGAPRIPVAITEQVSVLIRERYPEDADPKQSSSETSAQAQ